jgi:hypothetical protein
VLNRWWSIASLALCLGIGIPSRAQTIRPVPPTPIDIKKVELGGTPWNPQWDRTIEQALPTEMLSSQVPRGVLRFSPRFFDMDMKDKRTFWAYFFQALAGAEAGLKPNTSVRHSCMSQFNRRYVESTLFSGVTKPHSDGGLLRKRYSINGREHSTHIA